MEILKKSDVANEENLVGIYGARAKNGVILITLKDKSEGRRKASSQPVISGNSPSIDKVRADSVVSTRVGNKAKFVELL